MKKIWYAVFILVLFISVLGYKLIFSNSYIDDANKNMDINGLKLLMTEERPRQDVLDNGLLFSPGGFGCDVYKGRNNDLQVVFSGFPDVLNNYMLTNIETTNPAYHFYNIRVGDSIEKAREILIKTGFKDRDKSGSGKSTAFTKRKLAVSFLLNDKSEIIKMSISLSQTNKKGIVF